MIVLLFYAVTSRCRFVNDVLHIRKRKEDLLGRAPVEGTHGEVVVFVLPYRKLFLEVLEGIELVRGVKVFVVLPVAAFDLSVMPWRKDLDELVLYPQLVQCFLKECRTHGFRTVHSVRELGAVVRLDTFDGIGELLHAMPDKLGGRIGTVFFEAFQIPKTAVLIDESELKEAAVERRVTNETGCRDEFHVNLYPLAWVLHLFVGLGSVFRVWQLHRQLSALLKEAIQAGNGSPIAALTELHPEHDQTSIWVSAPHFVDELDLIGSVLIGVAVRTVRAILQRLQRSVIAFHPAVDVLPVCPVPDRRCCDAIFLCVVN